MQKAIFFLTVSLIISGVIVSLYIKNNYLVKNKDDVFLPVTESVIGNNSLVQLYRESALLLVLSWKDLPLPTHTVNIYRSLTNQNRWEKWKTIIVDESISIDGFIKIEIDKASDINDYDYYIQILDQSGATIVGTPITILPSPLSQHTSASTTASEIVMPVKFSAPTSPSLTLIPGTTSPQATTPTPPSKSPTPIQNTYYNPDGTISGYRHEPSDKFRVTYVNKNIEIAWDNFTEQFDTLVISRSNSSQGPWFDLIQQTSVDANKSHFFRLVDNSFYQDHYYRLELILNSKAVATYGPVLLPKFEY